MPEGGPRFESFEVTHSPERGDSLHSPELTPDTCGVRLKIREWPAYGSSRIFREGTYMSAHMRCDTCPVRMDQTLFARLSDEALEARRAELRELAGSVFLAGCKELSEEDRLDPSHLPQELL